MSLNTHPNNYTRCNAADFCSFRSSAGWTIQKDYKGEASEDRFTGSIEKRTAQIPSSAFLGAALTSMGVSLALKIMGRDDWALFVGQWAAPFLILGEYNKLIKIHGSDADSRRFAA